MGLFDSFLTLRARTNAVIALRMPVYSSAASALRLQMEIQIRCFKDGDERALRWVFYSAIHQVARAA